ncbi:MAG TPA: YdeI/OmpD-associated family protein [Eoetvoesiella sp.]|uniref:YdeI/OmpD-associated family protein n=1 Tax=Eoetvoesiella sp. TaxID=1966355 RepID=UPI002D01B640|nr:YdeI/OmpD-associated family protein [Eoetvoesiella sp.]HWK63162.1 YdeI/OmpD-associated family protein [Eoetvoesiella sp.]
MPTNLTHKNEPILTFGASQELEAHMSNASGSSNGFWLRLAKAGAPTPTIGKEDAIEAALCCGWIDGQLARFDEHYFLVRMTPRRPGSRWSAKNRDTADRLEKEGRLRPAGLAEIEAAKADGRWDAAYASQGTAEIPEDLAAALASNEAARRFFETLDRANRYAVIYRVNDAKRAETRARRIVNFVEMLARGETIHPRKASRTSAAKNKKPLHDKGLILK